MRECLHVYQSATSHCRISTPQAMTLLRSASFQFHFFPKGACLGFGLELWSALQGQGSSLTHAGCIIWAGLGTQSSSPPGLFNLGTGDVQACCHVRSPFFISIMYEFCYKDQDPLFLFIILYCHFLRLRSPKKEDKAPISCS